MSVTERDPAQNTTYLPHMKHEQERHRSSLPVAISERLNNITDILKYV